MGDERQEISGLLERRKILRGLAFFALLTVAGLVVVYFTAQTPATIDALSRIDLRYLTVALLLVPVDLWFGGIRNHILLKRRQPELKATLALRANLANIFMAAVTPSQLGGGIAQIYLFRTGGVSLQRGMAVTVVTFTSTLSVFVLSALLGTAAVRHEVQGEVERRFLLYGAAALTLVFTSFVLAVWRPELVLAFIRATPKIVRSFHGRTAVRARRLADRLVEELRRAHESIQSLFREDPLAVGANFLATAALYWTKFTIGYLVMRGLGVDAPYLHVMAIQAVLLFVIYFTPTPGGSGFAELGTGVFMAMVMPGYLLPVYTVIYRFLLVYLQAALGAWVLARQLSRDSLGG